jgi:hypothetical protein
MLGKYQRVFRSRWRALWWSAGVLMTAYCTVPSTEETAALGEVASAAATKKQHAHYNPWAVDPKR